MTNQEIIKAFNNIKSWQKGSERAPHKPLLLLLALGEVQRGNTQKLRYKDVEEKLKQLLLDFGSPRKSQRPQYPFTRLANDRIWVFNKPEILDTKIDPSPDFLIKNEIAATFPENILIRISADKELFRQITLSILEKNFPESLHEDILANVGIDLTFDDKRKRNPAFREQVLIAYGYECAICGFSIRLASKNIALEASHIKWFEAKGPDAINNGVAFCTMHHKLFDFGAFTISEERNLLVSDLINGNGANEWLFRFNGKKIKSPQSKNYYPEPEYIDWHVREVFKGRYRDIID